MIIYENYLIVIVTEESSVIVGISETSVKSCFFPGSLGVVTLSDQASF